MDSPPNNEWEQLLDIDDSDLRLSATTQNIVSSRSPKIDNYYDKFVRKIPGPEGIVQTAKIRKIADIQEGVEDVLLMTQEYIRKVVYNEGEDSDFKSGPRVRAVEFLNVDGGIMVGCFADIKKFCKKGKLDKVVWIIKSCTLNVLGDLTVTLKNVSSLISGTIYHKVLTDEKLVKAITVGDVLILQNVSVFSPKESSHYLNSTIKNVAKVFSKDT